jgi:hypothetical protein
VYLREYRCDELVQTWWCVVRDYHFVNRHANHGASHAKDFDFHRVNRDCAIAHRQRREYLQNALRVLEIERCSFRALLGCSKNPYLI